MEISTHIFREYDIRGYVGKELSADFAFVLGQAYGEMCLENNKSEIAIGYDCRISSKEYAEALALGIATCKVRVQITGMGPTPQLYFAVFHRNLGGGIQVTGSHNPSDMNGFKLCLGTQTLSGKQIQDLKEKVEKLARSNSALNLATLSDQSRFQLSSYIRNEPIQTEYTNYLIDNCKAHMGARKVRVVVDAGNGVGGMVGPKLLRALGAEVIELYCDPDGSFPNHHPDPTELSNIVDLQNKVRETGADLGIGWDGDADRIGAVDEKGQVIYGDMLLLIFGRELLKTVPKPTIIGDVKCSSRLFDDLNSRGANAVIWKTGHSLVKSKLKELDAELAGEMSGHIFFKHRYFGFDDALYASARLIEIISKTDLKASDLLKDLPKMYSTPEIRVDCAEDLKFKIAALARDAFGGYKVDLTDGVRISFEKGWGLVRASNTQPILVLRFEAETPQLLDSYQTIVTKKIDEIKDSLK